jgi:hypothetical protein
MDRSELPPVAARNIPSLRRVGVEDRAVVLHLLTNRLEDLVPSPCAPRPLTGCTALMPRE